MDNSQPNKDKSSLPAQDAHFQPVYAMPPHYADDEISLVDLAKILIRRKLTFLITFLAVVAVAGFLAWNKSQARQVSSAAKTETVAYQTLLAVGYKRSRLFIEPMESIKYQLDKVFIPRAAQGLNLEGVSTQVSFTERKSINEEGSNLIIITSKSSIHSSLDGKVIAELHKNALEPLLHRHAQLFEHVKATYNPNSLETPYQFLPTEIAVLAAPVLIKPNQSRVSSSLIMALGIFMGLVTGFVAAFLKEFASRVKQSLEEDRLSKV